MFGFLFRRQAEEVRCVLSRHMNRDFLKKFRYGKRIDARGGFCQPVWIVPIANEEALFDQAFPVITKDICPEGLSLICTEPMLADRVAVGLGEGERMHFVVCTREHSTPVGLGFHQVGLHPERLLSARPSQIRRMRERADELTAPRGEPCPA